MPATAGTKRAAEEEAGASSSGEDVKVGSPDANGGANNPKRKKRGKDETNNEGASSTLPTNSNNNAPLQLPAVVWGNVLNFMPYEDVRSTLLVGKLIAVEAAKHVQTSLNIVKSTQMVGPPARRFPNVTEVNIFCLLIHKVAKTPQEFTSNCKFCTDTAIRTVPFVSMFSKLKWLFVGGRNIFPAAYDFREDMWFPARPMRIWYVPSSCTGPAGHETVYQSLVMAFCGTFKTRNISMNIASMGGISEGNSRLCRGRTESPYSHPRRGRTEDPEKPCTFCRSVCQHFPFVDVDESILCLSLLERYKIILSRQGGRKFLEKVAPEKIMDIVEYGMDSFYTNKKTDAGKEFIEKMIEGKRVDEFDSWDRVKYINKGTFAELDELIEATCVDPKNLDMEYVFKRMKRFAWHKMLAKSTFDGLVARGFNLGTELPLIVDKTKEPALEGLAEEINSYESDSIEEESSDSGNE